MKSKYCWMILVALAVVIVLPPIIHGYIYPTGGDDTAWHLIYMMGITPTEPFNYPPIYYGQFIVGYPIVLLQSYLHIPITISFLWFNYLVLIGMVVTMFLVFSKLYNNTVGILTALASFLLSTTVSLFLAGAIFNIINMSIILPWLIFFSIMAVDKQSWKYAIGASFLIALFAVFHSTGVYLLATPFIVLIVWLLRKRIHTKESMTIAVLGILAVALLIIAFPLQKLSLSPGRQAVDATGLIIIIAAIGTGLFLTHKAKSATVVAVSAIGILGLGVTLPMWFANTTAIKPIDRQVIAYVNSLPESSFYGNEFLAPYVYQPYLTKTYQPDSGIYIWRSNPITVGVIKGSEYNYWQREGKGFDTEQPTQVKSMKYFAGDGIAIYVAEVNR